MQWTHLKSQMDNPTPAEAQQDQEDALAPETTAVNTSIPGTSGIPSYFKEERQAMTQMAAHHYNFSQ